MMDLVSTHTPSDKKCVRRKKKKILFPYYMRNNLSLRNATEDTKSGTCTFSNLTLYITV